jgi:hypothetical protein
MRRTSYARRRLVSFLVEAGVDKAFKSAIEFTKSCNESQLPMNAKTFKSWLGHELRKPY